MSESTIGQVKMESESTVGQGKASDIISRQKVLNIIDWVHYHYCFPPSQERLFDYLKDIIIEYEIEHAPTIDPVKHGKWLRTDGYPHHIYCSECFGTYIPNDEWEIWKSDGEFSYRLPRDYCPNCGAKMDKGEDE